MVFSVQILFKQYEVRLTLSLSLYLSATPIPIPGLIPIPIPSYLTLSPYFPTSNVILSYLRRYQNTLKTPAFSLILLLYPFSYLSSCLKNNGMRAPSKQRLWKLKQNFCDPVTRTDGSANNIMCFIDGTQTHKPGIYILSIAPQN